MNRWAQKIFNRLEWPDLLKVFQSRAVQVNGTVKDLSAKEPQSQLVLPRIPAEDLQLRKNVMEYLAGRLVHNELSSYPLRVGVKSLIFFFTVLDGL